MEVMQPHRGHSYSSWAISSFVRRGGVYLIRRRDVSILFAATGPTSGILASSSTEVRAIFQRASYPRSIRAWARDGSRPRTFSRWTREAGSDSLLMRRFGRPAAGGTGVASRAAAGDRSSSAAGARKREWHWSQMTCQGFRAPHSGHVASRSSWRASRRIVAAPHDSHRMNGKSLPPQELQEPRFSTFCVTGGPPFALRRNRGGGKSVGSD